MARFVIDHPVAVPESQRVDGMGRGRDGLSARAGSALIIVLCLVASACSAPATDQPSAGDSTSLSMPLPSVDAHAAFREAEAELRRDARERSGLAKLGPGALELAGLMDRTTSFLLAQVPAQLGTLRASLAGGGRLAAPRRDLPAPGVPVFSAYIMTSMVFTDLIGRGQDTSAEAQAAQGEKCPCTKTGSLGDTVDEVTVAGNKGTIKTSTTATATVNGSKVSVDIKIKVSGEVRDGVTNAILYKVENGASGHADGDACPDATGTARGRMTFDGYEDQFDSNGAKVGSRKSEQFGGEMGIRADDNAKLAGVDLKTSGQGAALLMKWAATAAAPAFEKAWRSGMCIEVLVDPDGKDVDKDSETTVTVKVKHKIEGNELDKPVEAKLTGGVKTIEPSGSKQKAPATFKYKAGSEEGDRGGVRFESISNRGIGSKGVGFLVAGGWTISSVGTSKEDFQSVISNSFDVIIKDLKITAGKDGALTGTGSMRLSGSVSSGGFCTGQTDQTIVVTASGTLVGTGPGALLRLTLYTPAVPGVTLSVTCRSPFGGPATVVAIGGEGHADRYGEALGQIELPADGGSKSISRASAIGGVMNVSTVSTFTVVRPKR